MVRQGLSIAEILIALFIVGLLAALLLPAAQASRESSRRIVCASNLRQIILATHAYEYAQGSLPPGQSGGNNVFVALLPYYEQQGLENLFLRLNDSLPANEKFREIDPTIIPFLLCPSDGAPAVYTANGYRCAGSNYAANSGTWHRMTGFDGPFRFWWDYYATSGPPLRLAELSRGTSQIAGFSEILRGDGSFSRLRTIWILPTTHTDINDYADTCQSLPMQPTSLGLTGLVDRGAPWRQPSVSYSLYNHVTLPNSPSCQDATSGTVNTAASANSQHTHLVHVAYLDGHISPVSDQIDRSVWRAQAPR
jgi:type II secretory pathway pseudopilin PulG